MTRSYHGPNEGGSDVSKDFEVWGKSSFKLSATFRFTNITSGKEENAPKLESSAVGSTAGPKSLILGDWDVENISTGSTRYEETCWNEDQESSVGLLLIRGIDIAIRRRKDRSNFSPLNAIRSDL